MWGASSLHLCWTYHDLHSMSGKQMRRHAVLHSKMLCADGGNQRRMRMSGGLAGGTAGSTRRCWQKKRTSSQAWRRRAEGAGVQQCVGSNFLQTSISIVGSALLQRPFVHSLFAKCTSMHFSQGCRINDIDINIAQRLGRATRHVNNTTLTLTTVSDSSSISAY